MPHVTEEFLERVKSAINWAATHTDGNAAQFNEVLGELALLAQKDKEGWVSVQERFDSLCETGEQYMDFLGTGSSREYEQSNEKEWLDAKSGFRNALQSLATESSSLKARLEESERRVMELSIVNADEMKFHASPHGPRFGGFPIVIDESLPPTSVELRHPLTGEVLLKIVNVGTDPALKGGTDV